MTRSDMNNLKAWFTRAHRKPLILRGARQVGKTYLVRAFTREQGLELAELNLERHLELKKAFITKNPRTIIGELEGITGKKIQTGQSLLFLDEIQAIPEAIAALRYFHEELPDLAVIAAGSLLEFVLGSHSFSMPVGRVSYLHMGPLTFLEFLDAVDTYSAQELRSLADLYHTSATTAQSLHQRLKNRLREYLYIGGMPEAVAVYLETQDLQQVSQIHDSIIHTYFDDFAKYAGKADPLLLQTILRRMPSSVGQKILYTRFSEDHTSRPIKHALELLIQAKLITKVVHSDANGVPLGAEMDESVFKLLNLDIGLMNRMAGISPADIRGLSEQRLINEGALAEQFVGQQLLRSHELNSPLLLHYWQRSGKKGNAEVDYIIQLESDIIPLEVKAGTTGTLKSLHQFIAEKHAKLAVRLDLNPPSFQQVSVSLHDASQVTYPLISLPLYAAELLPRVIRNGTT